MFTRCLKKRAAKDCKINTAAPQDTEKQPFATFWKRGFLSHCISVLPKVVLHIPYMVINV